MSNYDSDMLKTLCNILRQVHGFSWELWKIPQTVGGRRVETNAYGAYDSLAKVRDHYPLEPKPLEARLRAAERSRDLSLYLNGGVRFYLPPLDENPDFIATLSVECKLTEPDRRFCIRIEMYTLFTKVLRGIGYRFEFGAGEHLHSHMTLANKRPDREGGASLLGCPEWLPTYIPRVPTSAKTPVSLMVCLLISLYGKNGYARIVADRPKSKYLSGLEHILNV